MNDWTEKEGQEAEEAYEAEKRKRFAKAPAAQREAEDELEEGFTLLRSELLDDGGHCTYWRRSSGDTVVQVRPDGSTKSFEGVDWWTIEQQLE